MKAGQAVFVIEIAGITRGVPDSVMRITSFPALEVGAPTTGPWWRKFHQWVSAHQAATDLSQKTLGANIIDQSMDVSHETSARAIASSEAQNAEPQEASHLYKALSNDLRLKILTLLTERGGTLSPVQMAEIIGADVKLVSHHTKQLVRYGCAEEVSTRPRRGAVEHFYKATTRPVLDGEDWEAMSLPAKMVATKQAAQRVLDDLEASFQTKIIERRTNRHLTRTPLVVDEQGWEELQEIHRRAFEECLNVEAKSDTRRAESGAAGIPVSSSQLCFEMPLLDEGGAGRGD